MEEDPNTVQPVPVAPPRAKRRSKQPSELETSSTSPAPVPPSSPAAPRRPPPPRPRPRNTESTDSTKVLQLLKHPKVVKTASVPLRPPPPQCPSPDLTKKQSVYDRLSPLVRPQAVPPRPKSSLDNHVSHNGHSRSASTDYSTNMYGTGPRRKKSGISKRTMSEDSSVATKVIITKVNSSTKYMNVAPRPRIVKQSSLNPDKLSARSKPSGSPTPKMDNDYHKHPTRSLQQPQQGKKPRPPRPAPPPPHKVAQYTRIYSEIGPRENRLPSEQEDNYSYVSLQPRFVAGVSRQVDGLDLQVPATDQPPESYVNHDYHGPENPYYKRASSVEDHLYMSLSAHTMDDDIYSTVPHQEHVPASVEDQLYMSLSAHTMDDDIYMVPHHEHVPASVSPQYNGMEEDSDESDEYSTPDDARHPSQSPDQEEVEDLYMSLSTHTKEESSIYQALSVVQPTS